MADYLLLEPPLPDRVVHRPLMQFAESLQLRRIRPHDPTPQPERLLAGTHPPPLDPMPKRPDRDPQRPRQLRPPPLVRTKARPRMHARPPAQAQPTAEVSDGLEPESFAARRLIALLIQALGDALRRQARLGPGPHPLDLGRGTRPRR